MQDPILLPNEAKGMVGPDVTFLLVDVINQHVHNGMGCRENQLMFGFKVKFRPSDPAPYPELTIMEDRV